MPRKKKTTEKRENPKNLIFLDFDGCVTSLLDKTSYLSGDISTYGVSKRCIDHIRDICSKCDAKVVISSNWVRIEDEGLDCWKFGSTVVPNPLPKLREKLGPLLFDHLPGIRHCTKAERLILWFEENDWFNGNFVIFDDDPRENFQTTHDYGICDHFIKCNSDFGITSKDTEAAMEILNGKPK